MISAKQKLVENEAKFREFNESVEEGYEKLERMAKDQGWDEKIVRPSDPFYFYCECANEDCNERVLLTLENYSKIHDDRRRFTVVCGHEVASVEHTIEHGEDYCIVEKFVTPPEDVDALHKTNL